MSVSNKCSLTLRLQTSGQPIAWQGLTIQTCSVDKTRIYNLKHSLLLLQVLNQTEDHRQRVLQAASKTMRVWFIKVRKMKAIYHTLNLCNIDVTQKCLIAEVWCPVSDLDSIQFALRRGTVSFSIYVFTLTTFLLLWCSVMSFVLCKSSGLQHMQHVADTCMLYLTGEEWLHGAVHPQQDADQANSTYLQQDQQVHVRLPKHCWCLWHRELPGNQSRS